MKPFTFWLAKRLVKTDYVSLPNLLAGAHRRCSGSADAARGMSHASHDWFCHRPAAAAERMVVGYRMKPFTFWLAKRLVKTDYVSLPNLLAGREASASGSHSSCSSSLTSSRPASRFGNET
jgi:lipid A disaccharide synthetase